MAMRGLFVQTGTNFADPLAMEESEIKRIVETELSRISDESMRERIRALAVPPLEHQRIHHRAWKEEAYQCWLVFDLQEREVVIVYACGGYADRGHPWGLATMNMEGPNYSGSPGAWYRTLNECVCDYGFDDGETKERIRIVRGE